MEIKVKTISIIITTRNRAAHLRETLKTIARLPVPPDFDVELIVVDNASTDETANVVCSVKMENINLVYLYEAKPGQTNARNAAIAEAKGDILLWTDDDVRPPEDWIEAMCSPILRGEAAGVGGKICMAPHLERDWMTQNHYDRLCDTRFMPENFGSMIGANMAFHREVLLRVPGFDTELGPGKLGFMDDSLFCFQMLEEGYKIVPAPLVLVEHHFEPSRLQRQAWLKHAETSGRSQAYVHYHWNHKGIKLPILQLLLWHSALLLFRATHPPRDPNTEGCHRYEMRIVQNISFIKQYLIERKRPQKYQRALKQ